MLWGVHNTHDQRMADGWKKFGEAIDRENEKTAIHNAEEAKKPNWRIVWKSLLTGYTGYGDACFTHTEAEDEIKDLNAKHAGVISHWVQHKNDALPKN
jgi:hypothetical protein